MPPQKTAAEKMASSAKVVRSAVELRSVMDLRAEVENRRTFAIISHPDAGKTTLTEKLLLYGGAIVTAGQVAARRRPAPATSDWMELERERGISITSTVLQFPYRGHTINLLDTPGHQDFGEDTYRTLLAADSRGHADRRGQRRRAADAQAVRDLPRARAFRSSRSSTRWTGPSRDPLELLDELENVLGIGAYPMNWPLGSGETFRGVYDRATREVHLFERTEHGAKRAPVSVAGVATIRGLRALVDERTYREFLDGIELLEGAGADVRSRRDAARRGHAGVLRQRGDELRRRAVPRRGSCAWARRRRRESTCAARGRADRRATSPASSSRFKRTWIRATATASRSLRVCSGTFERDMTVRNARTGKDVRLTRADEAVRRRSRIGRRRLRGRRRRAWRTPASFAIGDTLSEGDGVRFDPIPAFEPEHFALVRSIDTASYKSFQKGIAQLREEGAIQVFYPYGQTRTEPILAAVGALQFEVVKYRLESEYNVKTVFTNAALHAGARASPATSAVAAAQLPSNAKLVEDWDGAPAGALRERVEHPARRRVEPRPDVRTVRRARTSPRRPHRETGTARAAAPRPRARRGPRAPLAARGRLIVVAASCSRLSLSHEQVREDRAPT